jgi:hypothetical protein
VNRAEIIEEYNLFPVLQSDQFRDNYSKIRALVGNKDRAYERLVKNGGKTNRRTAKKPASSSIESVEAS